MQAIGVSLVNKDQANAKHFSLDVQSVYFEPYWLPKERSELVRYVRCALRMTLCFDAKELQRKVKSVNLEFKLTTSRVETVGDLKIVEAHVLEQGDVISDNPMAQNIEYSSTMEGPHLTWQLKSPAWPTTIPVLLLILGQPTDSSAHWFDFNLHLVGVGCNLDTQASNSLESAPEPQLAWPGKTDAAPGPSTAKHIATPENTGFRFPGEYVPELARAIILRRDRAHWPKAETLEDTNVATEDQIHSTPDSEEQAPAAADTAEEDVDKADAVEQPFDQLDVAVGRPATEVMNSGSLEDEADFALVESEGSPMDTGHPLDGLEKLSIAGPGPNDQPEPAAEGKVSGGAETGKGDATKTSPDLTASITILHPLEESSNSLATTDERGLLESEVPLIKVEEYLEGLARVSPAELDISPQVVPCVKANSISSTAPTGEEATPLSAAAIPQAPSAMHDPLDEQRGVPTDGAVASDAVQGIRNAAPEGTLDDTAARQSSLHAQPPYPEGSQPLPVKGMLVRPETSTDPSASKPQVVEHSHDQQPSGEDSLSAPRSHTTHDLTRTGPQTLAIRTLWVHLRTLFLPSWAGKSPVTFALGTTSIWGAWQLGRLTPLRRLWS